MRIPKQINKITLLTVHSKRNYWSLGFPKRNHSPNRTVAGASRGYHTSSRSGEKKNFGEKRNESKPVYLNSKPVYLNSKPSNL
ncbi:hypothetical protein LXL04_013946 [Taraxacum kok-saghyz]